MILKGPAGSYRFWKGPGGSKRFQKGSEGSSAIMEVKLYFDSPVRNYQLVNYWSALATTPARAGAKEANNFIDFFLIFFVHKSTTYRQPRMLKIGVHPN